MTTSFIKIVYCPGCLDDSGNRITLIPALDRAGPKDQQVGLFCKECGEPFDAVFDKYGMRAWTTKDGEEA
jgi:hypothetical protein